MLYKKTRLEDTFGVNMLAVADGRPETLGLKQIIAHHVDFPVRTSIKKIYDISCKGAGQKGKSRKALSKRAMSLI